MNNKKSNETTLKALQIPLNLLIIQARQGNEAAAETFCQWATPIVRQFGTIPYFVKNLDRSEIQSLLNLTLTEFLMEYPEIPSEEEMRNGFQNLAKHDNKVDYIVTHCLPTNLQYVVKKGTYHADAITHCLEAVIQGVEFKHWYCGHYHYNIDASDIVTIVFSRILKLGDNIAEAETMMGVPKYLKGDAVLIQLGEEILLGKITQVMPYGTLRKHDAPYYDIELYDKSRDEPVVTIKETQIIEKSLADF